MWKTLLLTAVLLGASFADDDMCFYRGDADGNGYVEVWDVYTINAYLAQQNPTIHDNLDALDANDDGAINVADPSYLVGILFYDYTWPEPNYTSGKHIDFTPDDINSDYDWPEGETAGSFGSYEGTWSTKPFWNEWPSKSCATAYTPDSPVSGSELDLYGREFEVETDPSGTYGGLYNGAALVHTYSTMENWPWGGFKSQCYLTGSFYIEYKIEAEVEMSSPNWNTPAAAFCEADAEMKISVLVYNVTQTEFALFSSEDIGGKIGLVVESDGYELDEDYDNWRYGGWENSGQQRSGQSLSVSEDWGGAVNLTCGDVDAEDASEVASWAPSDVCRVVGLYMWKDIAMTHDKQDTYDATLSDYVVIKAACSKAEMRSMD